MFKFRQLQVYRRFHMYMHIIYINFFQTIGTFDRQRVLDAIHLDLLVIFLIKN